MNSRVFLWVLIAPALAAGELPRLAPIPRDQPFAFAVLGDNRGDDTGEQPAAFRQILRAVNRESPAFSVNTGDMIYGRSQDEAVARAQWRTYLATTAELDSPLFHVPGNHDIWSEASARLYAETLGPPFYAFDYGRARFIALDCETEPSRLGTHQLEWLERQFAEAGSRLVFVFLHRPLFPVDGAIGSSMDVYPAERDRLHRLFVKHRRAIQGVFLGHEHLYHVHERDGVRYYITGGAGADLYMAPELGGFHHYLLVRVEAERVTTELRKVGAPVTPLAAPRRVRPGERLESWEQGLFSFAWNYTVTTEITPAHSSEGERGLQMNFDLAQCPWPVVSLPLSSPWDLRGFEAMAVDVYLPAALRGDFALTTLVEGVQKHEAAPVRLVAGWNTVRAVVDSSWLPAPDRGAVRAVGWSLTAAPPGDRRGSVVFDNLRVERRGADAVRVAELREGWERPLFWRVADESVLAETTPAAAVQGERGLELRLDFARCPRPVLLARLNPPWDLTGVRRVIVEVQVPDDASGSLAMAMGLRAGEAVFTAPPTSLERGWNTVSVLLEGVWLPAGARAAAEQIEWTLSAEDPNLRGVVRFDHLRAGED